MTIALSPSNITIHTKFTGPFFELGTRPIEEATHDWIVDMIREGEAKVEAQLYPGHGVVTGAYKSSIHSMVTDSRHGTVNDSPDATDAIIGAWLEGSKSRNEKHRFKGYGMFRKARSHLRKLANELAGKVYARAVKRLT